MHWKSIASDRGGLGDSHQNTRTREQNNKNLVFGVPDGYIGDTLVELFKLIGVS
jgi:hypothetical protein